jgi:LuxR family transcriptional regulator, maltose regulon positive regulatory protein
MKDRSSHRSTEFYAQSAAATPTSRKVGVPCHQDWVVPRPRLMERLKRAAQGPLTIVIGPPGAGKTVEATAWAVTGKAPGPVAWVSLSKADHSQDLFWPYVVDALGSVGVRGIHVPQAAGDEGVFYTGPAAGLAAGLAAALADRESPVVLVLDDFQPDPNSGLLDEMVYLIRNAGPALRLILISRQDPPLPLHRYRLTGALTELRVGELAFNERETHALLAQHRVSLSRQNVQALCERTEGWAAGLRLAAMSMEGHPDPETFAVQFAGDDRAVVGYLIEEVIHAQSPGMRHLLLTTSVAERFDAELAGELAGEDAARCFPAMMEQNAFVVPLGRGWYRYHHMFSDALQLILRHETPGAPPSLHRRAAAWFSRKDLLAEAVRHAARAADWRYASWLIVDHLAVGVVAGLGTGRPFAELAEVIPEAAMAAAAEPEPALVVAAAALARGDDDTCAGGLRRAEQLLEGLPSDHAIPARLAAGVLRLARPSPQHLKGLQNTLAAMDTLLAGLPGKPLDEHPELAALVQYARGMVKLWRGELTGAAAALRSALGPAAEAGSDFQRRQCLGGLALAEALLGRFRQAADLATKAAQLSEVSASPSGRRVAVAHLASAWVAVERYRLDEARLELRKARLAIRQTPNALMSALWCLVTSRAELAMGAPEHAIEALHQARLDAGGPSWLDRRLAVAEAEAHADAHAPVAAAAAAQRAGGAESADSLVALARARLCAGDRAAAAGLLRPALSESMAAPSDVRVEAWLLDAGMAYHAGDHSRGRRSLDRALRLGEREQLVLPFAMARTWLYAVLRRDVELLRTHRRLLEPLAMGTSDRLTPVGAVEGIGAKGDVIIYGRLSARELDVLRHLSDMLTTEEIAMEMYVSVNTVKTHLKSIYRKLAVTRRGEAVRRAHHLELL